MRTITGLDELKAAEGEVLGTSDWHEVTQKDVDTFADVTGDHQWIHVDVDRAKDTPFGGTIAHGYLTLSLGPALNNQVFVLEGFAFALNYGLNKVRFPAPVPVPSKVVSKTIWEPPATSLTSAIFGEERIFAPTGTGAGKRTLLRP